jgi:serine acetyltransferase
MTVKKYMRFFYQPGIQVVGLIKLSKFLRKLPLLGKIISVFIDNLIFYFFSLEVTSPNVEVKSLTIGHATGVVLGGNGIRSSGNLHVSSGVVFARRYQDNSDDISPYFDIEGDLTVGANSVLLGPLTIKGPTIIGALSLVTKDILEPGVYVGTPAKKIRDL